ncbi:reverse transcriptase domain, reverse transcriptase zinc-binding domain protein [Tanacetum coccineum]
MRGFLWCHGPMKKGKAKDEGGLGIRRLEYFNSALMVSHIWKLLSLKESLWVKWIHEYKLNGRSFWDVPLCGLSLTTKVKDIVHNGVWNWPPDLIDNQVWSSIRPRDVKVTWYDMVWFAFGIHRHAFTLWMIVKHKLKTQDRACSWDVSANLGTLCSLCELQQDSHEHLFFECSFAQSVWNHVKGLAGLDSMAPDIYTIIAHIGSKAKRRTVLLL